MKRFTSTLYTLYFLSSTIALISFIIYSIDFSYLFSDSGIVANFKAWWLDPLPFTLGFIAISISAYFKQPISILVGLVMIQHNIHNFYESFFNERLKPIIQGIGPYAIRVGFAFAIIMEIFCILLLIIYVFNKLKELRRNKNNSQLH